MSGSSGSPSTGQLVPAPPEPGPATGPALPPRKASWQPSPAALVFLIIGISLAVVVIALNVVYLPGFSFSDRVQIAGVEAETFVALGIVAEVYLHYLDRVNPVPRTNVVQPSTTRAPELPPPPAGPPQAPGS